MVTFTVLFVEIQFEMEPRWRLVARTQKLLWLTRGSITKGVKSWQLKGQYCAS